MASAKSDTLVICYSRTGHSERVATRLAERLGATVRPLKAPPYKGAFGFLRAAIASLTQRHDLPPQDFGPLDQYKAVVICGPVWTSYPAAPLRALLKRASALPPAVGLFLTAGSESASEKALAIAEEDFGRAFSATAVLANPDEGSEVEDRKLMDFCAALEHSPQATASS
jgi:hypothetical protein